MDSNSHPKPWITTPLIESATLSKAAGCRIFLKLENLQPSGSFKSRGIGNLIRHAQLASSAPTKTHFYSSSGGNAGLACVTAAKSLSRPASVIVPITTKTSMIAKIKAVGAYEVVQHGASWAEADQYLREELLQKQEHGVYVPPFDHQNIWDGAATIIEELDERPNAIVCSVGGGGLFCGLQQGLEKKGWGNVDLLAMETKGADSLAESLQQRELVALKEITSIAKSLGAKRVASKTFELAQWHNVISVVLSDAEAAMGCWRLADDERLIVEPACGVNVAMCYDGRLKRLLSHLTEDSKVVIVVCGGSDITFEELNRLRGKYGAVEEGSGTDYCHI